MRLLAFPPVLLLLVLFALPVSADRPNIVFIMADDMGVGDVQSLNPASVLPTPNIDRLAKEGMTFTDGHSSSGVCTPTRYSVVTGRYSWRGRLKRGVLNGYGTPLIEAGRETVASFLGKQGYDTGVIGKWHLGLSFAPNNRNIDFTKPLTNTPVDHGFKHSYVIPASLDFPPYVYIDGHTVTDPNTVDQPKVGFPGYLRAGPRSEALIMDECLHHLAAKSAAFITERAGAGSGDKPPFFLYFPLTSPHKPVLPHPDFRGKSGIGPYGDFILQTDWTVGEVLKALDATGLTDNTLVMYTSDNGSFMYRDDAADAKGHKSDETIQAYRADTHRANGPLRGTKADIWEAGHRVPFFARWPGRIKAGSRCDETVCSVDLFATAAELAGVAQAELPDDAAEDSFSLVPLFEGRDDFERAPVIHHSASGFFAIRDGKWKLVAANGSGGREAPRGKAFAKPYHLYDLDADLAETVNQIDKQPEVAERLEQQLEALRSSGRSRAPKKELGFDFNQPDSIWIAPELWANPMEDWGVVGERLERTRAKGGGKNAGAARTVHSLTRRVEVPSAFSTRVRAGVVGVQKLQGSFGFHFGINSELNELRHSLIKGRGTAAMVQLEKNGARLTLGSKSVAIKGDLRGADGIVLELNAAASGACVLTAFAAGNDNEKAAELARVEHHVAPEKLVGNLALAGTGAQRTWFDDWTIEGGSPRSDTVFGPILFSQYTLSRKILKLTAQLPPLGPEYSTEVHLDIADTRHTASIDPAARTARFRVENWEDTVDHPYTLSFDYLGKIHTWSGTVRKDPRDKRRLTVAGFTGNTDPAFPNALLARNVAIQNPDVLFFSGDQIYESVGGFGIVREPVDLAIVNYHRKFWLCGWAFRELTKDRPTINLTDDHDVYQGNIWGGGGAKQTMATHAKGGYVMHPDFVNAVQRTQCSHHPDPYDNTPIQQGIDVVYGDMVYGGVSFAIIEDRKFKDGPQGKVNDWPGRPDHCKDKNYDVAKLDKAGLKLLGDRQLKFLDDWADDDPEMMKCVLSQTIFCNLANYHGRGQEFIFADLDSNGWPQSGRNRALTVMKKANAFHYAGDQHLPSIIHHGIDQHEDAIWSFCVPSIAAGYPRSWRPDKEGRPVSNRQRGLANTGNYQDGFGNRVTVHAIGNPAEKNRPGVLNTLHDKSSGHGMVTFDKTKKTVRMDCWRLQFDAAQPDIKTDQFPGWPKTIELK